MSGWSIRSARSDWWDRTPSYAPDVTPSPLAMRQASVVSHSGDYKLTRRTPVIGSAGEPRSAGVTLHPQFVPDLLYAGDFVGHILGEPLQPAVVHRAGQNYLTGLNPHLDLAGVDIAVLRQAFAH